MRSRELRNLMAGSFLPVPGIYDVLSARLLESLGFQALYLSGNALGLSLGVGQPLVTLPETVDAARRIAEATTAPLIVDAGGGFGSAIHARRAMRDLEAAGAAAIHMDDQPYPKRASYHLGVGGVAPAEELAAKLAVAAGARRDPDLLLIARTDVLKVTGSLEQAIERCRRYSEAGADAVMVLNLRPEQAGVVRAAIPDIGLAWFASPSDDPPTAAVLAEAGFGLALYPFQTIAVVAQAIEATWRDYPKTGLPTPGATPIRDVARRVQEVIGMEANWRIEAGTGPTGGR